MIYITMTKIRFSMKYISLNQIGGRHGEWYPCEGTNSRPEFRSVPGTVQRPAVTWPFLLRPDTCFFSYAIYGKNSQKFIKIQHSSISAI